MPELDYQAPATVEAALAALADDGARPLAGGTDLFTQVRERRRSVRALVDLKRIAELTRLERIADGGWRVGAAASIASLGRNSEFAREHAPLLAASRLIGSVQIQSRASLGGNLCNAAPSADAVPLLICLAAEAEIAGRAGRRRSAAEAIATAPGRTSLEPGELLVALHLPAPPPRSAARYLRFTPRREMDIAVAGAAARLSLDAAGRIAGAAIVLAAVGPVPVVATAAAASLTGEAPSRALFRAAAAVAATEVRPISDTRGSAEYRRHLVRVLTCRALAQCADDLGIATA